MCRLAATDSDRCVEPNTRTRAGPDLDQELLARWLNRIHERFVFQVQSEKVKKESRPGVDCRGGNRLCGQRRDAEHRAGDWEAPMRGGRVTVAPMRGGRVTVAPMGGGGITVARIRHRSGGESSATTAGSSGPPVTCPCVCPDPPRSRP